MPQTNSAGMLPIDTLTNPSFLTEGTERTGEDGQGVRVQARLVVIQRERSTDLATLIAGHERRNQIDDRRLEQLAIDRAAQLKRKLDHASYRDSPVAPSGRGARSAISYLQQVETLLAKQRIRD